LNCSSSSHSSSPSPLPLLDIKVFSHPSSSLPFSLSQPNHLSSLLPYSFPLYFICSPYRHSSPTTLATAEDSLYFLRTEATALQSSIGRSLSVTGIDYHLYVDNLISRKFKLALRRTTFFVSVLFS
jgi:hypothetical protein